MSARPTAELVTVEELLQLPNPKEGHYELHHGEVVLMPPPKWGHQRIQERIQMAIARVARERGVVMAEMAFRPLPEHEVWQADVGFISTGRAERIQEDEYLAGAPDLVVEVLSPSNTADEINDKMAVCLANGCSTFWVVDPKQKQVAVREGDITRHYGISATISFLGATVRVADLFR